MKRRILCLHLPNWPIQRVLAGRNAGQVSSLPVLLHARDPRRGQLVVATNEAALARGIRPGMPLAEAATLAAKIQGSKFKVQGLRDQRSEVGGRKSSTWNLEPGTLNCLSHDPAADLAELARLAEHCERFSPLVGWETAEASRGQRSEVRGQDSRVHERSEMHQPHGLFLDVTAIGVLFGGEERLAAEVVADLARLGYTAHVAVAGTVGAAWAAAQMRNAEFGMRNGDNEKSPTILPSLRTPHSAFRTLPLESLRLPAETLDLLAQLGLKQVGEVLALPRSSLRARFGERLLLRLDQLSGAAQETIVPYRPPPKFAAEWVLEYPAERQDVVEQILGELVGRVAAQLAERREGVVQLHCRLDCGSRGAGILPASHNGRLEACPTRIDVGLFRPSADAQHLGDLVRMQLAQMRLPGAVGRVTVQALVTAPLENRQGRLFAGGRDEAGRQLALLIDRLSSRLGPEAVLRPQLTADPLPERAVRNQFKVQSSRFKVRKKSACGTLNFEPGTLNYVFRPLFLRQPLPLDAVSVVPEGPPIRFCFQGREYHVAAHWGPERIETGWFRGPSIRRDYYRVETTEGLRFWLFRRLEDGKWHLHGEFS